MVYALLAIALTIVQVAGTGKANMTLQIFHDERCVKDLATLNLLQIAQNAHETWATASVVPGPNSGTMVAEGAHIDISTGKLVEAPNARYVTNIYGKLDILHVITNSLAQNSLSYQWELLEDSRDPEVRTRYSPFSNGGAIAFRYNADKKGVEQFRPIYLLPTAWMASLPAAVTHIKKDAVIFDSNAAKGNKQQLYKRLSDHNHLLAIAAFRTLAEAGAFGADFVEGTLVKANGIRQATDTFLLLKHITKVGGEQTIQHLEKYIEKASTEQDLSGLALGSLAALEAPSPQPTHLFGIRLLKHILKRWSTLPRQSTGSTYLDAISSIVDSSGILRKSQ